MTCEVIWAGSQLSPCHPRSLLSTDARAVVLVPVLILQPYTGRPQGGQIVLCGRAMGGRSNPRSHRGKERLWGIQRGKWVDLIESESERR